MNIQVLMGTLLGDAWIQKLPNRNKSYGFNYQQSEFDYALWKAQMCGVDYNISKNKRFDKRTKRYYYYYHVYLKVGRETKHSLFEEFYRPTKIVSKDTLKSLPPLAICIWYLDDGNLYYNGNNCHLTLSVDGFDDESQANVIEYFVRNHDIHFKVHGKAIRLTSKKEVKKFMYLVEKFIPKCMKRKKLKYQMERHDKTLTDEQRKCRNNKYK